MVRINIRTALLAMLVALVGSAFAMNKGYGASDEQICQLKNPRVVTAIKNYCTNSHFMIPSAQAGKGAFNGPDQAVKVMINGDCSPPQYVPTDICFKQFYWLCKTAIQRGGSNNFQFGWGNNKKCQNWSIMVN